MVYLVEFGLNTSINVFFNLAFFAWLGHVARTMSCHIKCPGLASCSEYQTVPSDIARLYNFAKINLMQLLRVGEFLCH